MQEYDFAVGTGIVGLPHATAAARPRAAVNEQINRECITCVAERFDLAGRLIESA